MSHLLEGESIVPMPHRSIMPADSFSAPTTGRKILRAKPYPMMLRKGEPGANIEQFHRLVRRLYYHHCVEGFARINIARTIDRGHDLSGFMVVVGVQ